ncbi:MAG: glutamine synthetase beta-grasp domain-containing protein [Myxococcales bacterium]|nr:glutamine synthetase beta-grasp domain-containing protein [Myxococcales bacterium]
MVKAEYIWVDGTKPTQTLRSKTRVLAPGAELPTWGFDGSSTQQAEGHASDCLLEPVFVCADPLRGGPHKLVLCEVMNVDGSPHASNQRVHLREVAARHQDQVPWFGIEQEYTMFRESRPLGWPEGGYPAPQGPFYCGVGADEVFGRSIAEAHLDACIAAGLSIYGINAEVMPGQWEFQVGTAGPLEVADHLVMARYLLYRIGEAHQTSMTLHPKPVRGDWNGAGAHTNFSTAAMRAPGGIRAIHVAIERLQERHAHHIAHYGEGIEQRLTGTHETCSFREFRYGDSDRGASVRIPPSTVAEGCGYFEDRRPCANVDPYVVTRLLIETVCG